MFIRDVSMRDMLHRMVDTAIGLRTGFAVSVGSLGRFRKHYLTKEEYARYRATYAANTEEDVWESLFVMLAMFGCLGRQVAAQCHYSYPEEDETFIRSYLERMRGKR